MVLSVLKVHKSASIHDTSAAMLLFNVEVYIYIYCRLITTCRALLAFDWMTNVQSHGLQALNYAPEDKKRGLTVTCDVHCNGHRV